MNKGKLVKPKTCERRTILDGGRFLRVELHRVEWPNGKVIDDWAWIVTPDYVNIVVETKDGLLLCFRQVKYALDEPSLAVVGGYKEPGEEALVSAKRELLEETGYEAAEWMWLGSYPVDGNRGVGRGHFFLARGARRVAEPRSDDLEEQEMLFLTRDEARDALARGDFKLMPWAAVMAIALLRLPQ